MVRPLLHAWASAVSFSSALASDSEAGPRNGLDLRDSPPCAASVLPYSLQGLWDDGCIRVLITRSEALVMLKLHRSFSGCLGGYA